MECYEKITGRTLHKFRSELNTAKTSANSNKTKKDKTPSQTVKRSNTSKPAKVKCPTCGSGRVEKKGKRYGKQRYVCKNCRKNWSEATYSSSSYTATSSKINEEVAREMPIEKIRKYLKDKYLNIEPIEFYYRDDKKPRKIHSDYHVDNTYVHVHSDSRGHYIKFRIDRIRKI